LFLRILTIFIVIYLLYSTVKAFLAGKRPGSRDRGSVNHAEDMVLDPQCQSYVPMKDAVAKGGKYFCSEECARLYLSR
jgi:hypothetical protein